VYGCLLIYFLLFSFRKLKLDLDCALDMLEPAQMSGGYENKPSAIFTESFPSIGFELHP
jgi:hypothetical protein